MSIIINGKNLVYARMLNGISLQELSDKIESRCTKQYLSQLEHRVDWSLNDDELVAKISNVLMVEKDFLTKNIFGVPLISKCFFRSQKTTRESAKERFAIIASVISKFVQYIKEYYQFYDEFEIEKQEYNTFNDIEVIAEKHRKKLGLGIDTPINSMTTEMERMGFIIIDSEFDLDNKIDSCFFDETNKIILNNKFKITENACRYRFSLAHELGHALLHDNEINDDDDKKIHFETEANRFASAFLLPRVAFFREFDFLRTNFNIIWDKLDAKKIRWKVSKQAMIRRAFDLGLIDQNKYTSAMITFARKGERFAEKDDGYIQKEEKILLNTIERYLNEDYFVIDDFIKKTNITLGLFNKIMNFNIKNRNSGNGNQNNIVGFYPTKRI
jgi:Zn-dependent peptidase ImmA (M78 family)